MTEDLPPTALFILFPGAARAGFVATDFGDGAGRGLAGRAIRFDFDDDGVDGGAVGAGAVLAARSAAERAFNVVFVGLHGFRRGLEEHALGDFLGDINFKESVYGVGLDGS